MTGFLRSIRRRRGARQRGKPPRPTSVVTRTKFAVLPEQAWDGLVFYEQIAERPPLPLRLLLPVPIRTEGGKAQVGDEARCLYEGGHLLKRITRIDRGRHYEFEVVEQNLAVGGGIRLAGGSYTLSGLPDGRTEVALDTRYVSPKRPRWLWKPVEAALCHVFHRHILDAMRRNAESRDRSSRHATWRVEGLKRSFRRNQNRLEFVAPGVEVGHAPFQELCVARCERRAGGRRPGGPAERSLR